MATRMSVRVCCRPGMAVALMLAAVAGGLAARPALAAGSESEAKATALAANCKPGKVEIMRQVPGGNGETIYKITCTDFKEMYVLIACRMRLCSLLR
ncbi:conserved exported hypothetical protein [Azospirillaceae bacterium]